jgi:predicted nucleic acid-binding Zn ribbon protein
MEQVACDRCGSALVAGAAYCDRCGERTRRAKRMVRTAIRIEVLLVLAITAIVVGFSVIYYVQR